MPQHDPTADEPRAQTRFSRAACILASRVEQLVCAASGAPVAREPAAMPEPTAEARIPRFTGLYAEVRGVPRETQRRSRLGTVIAARDVPLRHRREGPIAQQ